MPQQKNNRKSPKQRKSLKDKQLPKHLVGGFIRAGTQQHGTYCGGPNPTHAKTSDLGACAGNCPVNNPTQENFMIPQKGGKVLVSKNFFKYL